jgi:hypothetical protein
MRQEEANGTEPFDGDATSNDRLGVADNPSQEAAISSYWSSPEKVDVWGAEGF